MAYRRECDNYETERAQQLQQIHDLKEHIQEKERQFLELEEQTDHVPGVPLPSSILGLGAYIPPGQVTTLHPFFIPQQGVPQSVPPPGNSHVPESHMGHFMPMPAISSHLVWQNQEAVADGSQLSTHNQYQPSQIDQNISTSSAQYEYEQSEGHILHPGYVVANVVPNQEVVSINSEAREEAQNLGLLESQQNQENSGNLHEELRMDSDKKIETKVSDDPNATHHSNQGIITEKQQSASSTPLSSDLSNPSNPEVTTESIGSVVLPDSSILSGRTANLLPPGKVLAPKLLDERSLLACIVRAIPAGSGGRIKISSTLPNRLGKMLAPLHWHDYKKKYGKLDDFVAGHPELFFIEGDFIQLREGAQEMISATAAIAKVAAAAAASIPYSSVLPSVAVTPMAQTHRLKKVPSIDAVLPHLDAGDMSSQQSTMQNQHANGVSNVVQGLTNVKILSKSKYQKELNGSENKSAQSSVHMTVANGTNPDGTRLAAHQNKGMTNGRQGMNFGGKHQGRDTSGAPTSRR